MSATAPETPRPGDDPARLTTALVERDLARLDLEWARERERRFLRTARDGTQHLPKHQDAVACLVFGVTGLTLTAVLAWFAVGSQVGLLILLPFSPLILLVVVVLASGVAQLRVHRAYVEGVAQYVATREAILARRSVTSPVGSSCVPPREVEARYTEDVARQIRTLDCERDLARLDLEWEAERKTLLISVGRGGERAVPTVAGAWAVAAFTGLVGVLLLLSPSSRFMGICFLAAGGCAGVCRYWWARDYADAFARHQTNRAAILARRARTPGGGA